MTAETFFPGTKGIITNYSNTYSAGAGRGGRAPFMVNEPLKCTAMLPTPILLTLESAVSWTNLPLFCYLSFMKFTYTREDLSIDVSITNVGLILTKLR